MKPYVYICVKLFEYASRIAVMVIIGKAGRIASASPEDLARGDGFFLYM